MTTKENFVAITVFADGLAEFGASIYVGAMIAFGRRIYPEPVQQVLTRDADNLWRMLLPHGAPLLTWLNIRTGMDKQSHAM